VGEAVVVGGWVGGGEGGLFKKAKEDSAKSVQCVCAYVCVCVCPCL
jgi:hypothetical protein